MRPSVPHRPRIAGSRGVGQALELGRSSFRALPWDQLQESDLLSNNDTGLHGRTVKARLGGVDAL